MILASPISGQDKQSHVSHDWLTKQTINPLLKLVRSRWLNIGLVNFLQVYEPRLRLSPDKHAKTELGQYSAILLTEQAWPITRIYNANSTFQKCNQTKRRVIRENMRIMVCRVINILGSRRLFMKQRDDTDLCAKGTSLKGVGGYALPENFKIERF